MGHFLYASSLRKQCLRGLRGQQDLRSENGDGKANGKHVWLRKGIGAAYCVADDVLPLLWDEALHVGSIDERLYAVGLEFGQVKWKFKTGGKILSSPAAVDGLIYFGSADGFLYAVEASSGVVKWKFDAQSPIRSSPAVQEGIVIFGTDQGIVYGLE